MNLMEMNFDNQFEVLALKQTVALNRIQIIDMNGDETEISRNNRNSVAATRVNNCTLHSEFINDNNITCKTEVTTKLKRINEFGKPEYELVTESRFVIHRPQPITVEPIIGHSGGYMASLEFARLYKDGRLWVSHCYADDDSEANPVPKKITPRGPGSWFVIFGVNGLYFVEHNSFAFCYDPVIIVTPHQHYLRLTPGKETIVLGEGGHVVFAGMGAVVIIVGEGGFRPYLTYDHTRVDPLSGVVFYLSVNLRAYRGRDENRKRGYILTQVCEQISLYYTETSTGLLETIFSDINPFLRYEPLDDQYRLPICLQGVVRDVNNILRVIGGPVIGNCPRIARASVDISGTFMNIDPFPAFLNKPMTEIRPIRGTLIVRSWIEETLEMPGGHHSCFYVPNLVVMFMRSATEENLLQSEDLMKVYRTRRVFTLESGLVHLCFVTPHGSILLSADETYLDHYMGY